MLLSGEILGLLVPRTSRGHAVAMLRGVEGLRRERGLPVPCRADHRDDSLYPLHVLPGVAGDAEGPDAGDQVAPPERQRHDVIRREQDISPTAAQAHVPVSLAQGLELFDRKVTLGAQLPRPTPG